MFAYFNINIVLLQKKRKEGGQKLDGSGGRKIRKLLQIEQEMDEFVLEPDGYGFKKLYIV